MRTDINYIIFGTGKKAYVGGRGGLGANLHLNDHVGINLELNTNMLSDKFNSKKGRNADWQFNALAGFTFTFGKSYKKTVPVYYDVEQVTPTTVIEKSEFTPVVDQSKKEITVRDTLKQNIFFALNSARIQDGSAIKDCFFG